MYIHQQYEACWGSCIVCQSERLETIDTNTSPGFSTSRVMECLPRGGKPGLTQMAPEEMELALKLWWSRTIFPVKDSGSNICRCWMMELGGQDQTGLSIPGFQDQDNQVIGIFFLSLFDKGGKPGNFLDEENCNESESLPILELNHIIEDCGELNMLTWSVNFD